MAATSTKTETPETTDPETKVDDVQDAEIVQDSAPSTPKVGTYVTDVNGRLGIVLSEGREPDLDKKESPEPVVFWFQGSSAPYGAELSTVAS